jgi:hypothetical protein
VVAEVARDREDTMKEPRDKKSAPRVERRDLQDLDRDIPGPREGRVDREPERSDRDAGAGRPVQLDEEGRSHRPGTDSPRPGNDGAPETSK